MPPQIPTPETPHPTSVPEQPGGVDPKSPLAITLPPGPVPLLMPSPRKSRIFTTIAVILAVAALLTAATVFMQQASINRDSEATAPVGQVSLAGRGGFQPATIRVKKGQSVVWTNADTQAHSLTAVSNGDTPKLEGFGTEDQLNQGETYTFTFEEAGTYMYNDPVNPLGSNGTVIVE